MTKKSDTESDQAPDWRDRIKVLLGIELVALVVSLAVAVMPRRGSGDLLNLPPDLASYARRVLVGFGAFNGVLLVLVLAVWAYTRLEGRANAN